MWDVLQDVARNITFILDRSRGSHRKCPTCRGSGLRDNAFIKWKKNEAQINQPCWFCEGIGVLPIAGLNGFVLARANPCLKAVDKHNKETSNFSSCSTIRGTIKISNRRLNVAFADLIFDCKDPEIDECRNYVKNSEEIQQELNGRSRANKSIMRSCRWEHTIPQNSALGLLLPVSKSDTSERVLESGLGYSAMNILHPSAELHLSLPLGHAVHSLHVNKTVAKRCLGHSLGDGPGKRVSFTQRATYKVLALDVKDSGAGILGQYITTGLSRQAKSYVVCTKRPRRVRKARNCVREKAIKQAMERARGLVTALKFRNVEDSLAADLYQQSDISDKSSSATESNKSLIQGSVLSLSMTHNTACLTGVEDCWQSWSRQMLLAVCKNLVSSSTV